MASMAKMKMAAKMAKIMAKSSVCIERQWRKALKMKGSESVKIIKTASANISQRKAAKNNQQWLAIISVAAWQWRQWRNIGESVNNVKIMKRRWRINVIIAMAKNKISVIEIGGESANGGENQRGASAPRGRHRESNGEIAKITPANARHRKHSWHQTGESGKMWQLAKTSASAISE